MSVDPQRIRSIVVLIDESVLCSDGGTRIDHNALESLLDDVARLWVDRLRCTLVVTGESTVGRIRCGKLASVSRARRNDVWGAVGRSLLESWITSRLGERGLKTGSLHLTRSSFADRETYGVVRDCLRGLEGNEAIPIVWDNGWINMRSSEQVSSDTDQLMGMIAGQAGAQMAIVGLAEPVSLRVGEEEMALGRTPLHKLDSGLKSGEIQSVSPPRSRMESVVAAARLLGALGIPLMVTCLKKPNALTDALRGESGNLILEGDVSTPGRDGVKRWLSAGAIPQGVIIVSPYAATQLSEEADRSSLLAAGVVDTVGTYRANDVVAVEDESRRLLGYGVAKYGSREVADLRGKRNVIVVHADHFFGLGLHELVETDEALSNDSTIERS